MVNQIFCENALDTIYNMPDGFIDCVITSPPYYGLRDYGHEEQIGAENSLHEYISTLSELFVQLIPKLKQNATLFINLGDCYAGSGKGVWNNTRREQKERYKPTPDKMNVKIHKDLPAKNLLMVPARFAIKMQDEGFILRNDIIWHKKNCMPNPVKDRFVNAHEHIFFFTINRKYFFDEESAKEPAVSNKKKKQSYNKYLDTKPINNNLLFAANKIYDVRQMRDVWSIGNKGLQEQHFAAYPEELVERCIRAGCPQGGIVYDPFLGSGTTAIVAKKTGRNYIGSEINSEYVEIANRRIKQTTF